MLRRLMVFGIGAIISILILSIGNNKLSNTFIAYFDSYNLDKRVIRQFELADYKIYSCLLYTSPSPRDGLLSRMPSSA